MDNLHRKDDIAELMHLASSHEVPDEMETLVMQSIAVRQSEVAHVSLLKEALIFTVLAGAYLLVTLLLGRYAISFSWIQDLRAALAIGLIVFVIHSFSSFIKLLNIKSPFPKQRLDA